MGKNVNLVTFCSWLSFGLNVSELNPARFRLFIASVAVWVVALLGVGWNHLQGHCVYKLVGIGWDPCQAAVMPCEGCCFLNCQDLGELGSLQAGLVMLWTWARGLYNYITENGGKKCAPDDFTIAGPRSIDSLTLAALCVFFFLKWIEPCLLLWDVLLLFRKVMGKLLVVDKWAATGKVLWPSDGRAGLGSRLLHFFFKRFFITYLFIYSFIYGCFGSLFQCEGFL